MEGVLNHRDQYMYTYIMPGYVYEPIRLGVKPAR